MLDVLARMVFECECSDTVGGIGQQLSLPRFLKFMARVSVLRIERKGFESRSREDTAGRGDGGVQSR